MNGVVFTEFIEMTEGEFGLQTVDNIINRAGVEGIYTSIGTYPHEEMMSLVAALSQETEIEVSVLLENFGGHMFKSFVRLYPSFFEHSTNSFEFLENVEGYIHTKVQKIYPEAELPTFETVRLGPNKLEMRYQSDRRMGDFALGLIQGCLDYFKEDAEIQKTLIDEKGSRVDFLIELK